MTHPQQEEFNEWAREYNKRMGLRFERRDPSEVGVRCVYCVEGIAEGWVIWREFGIHNAVCRPCQNDLVDKINRDRKPKEGP